MQLGDKIEDFLLLGRSSEYFLGILNWELSIVSPELLWENEIIG